ncbi:MULTISPECIES: UvrY/SirA/GacA family response regulator transcription factor [unclassified Arsukibacterium]|uniref:UvrY/SirA/GacA family response regulator transcription factor n=1 Tax=unclassified Arsukibacterium TaxID=2635278 RepID=UPI000C4825BC|nr:MULTISPECIES: UvrY/SirA/GacA family response regulator transcription factor [unclassified Arsukibacterium]MBM33423.1 two-component system response regulator UvrY [Rheinheimera sp.]
MINVLLVDDHELVRTGISRILMDERGIKVIGEAGSGEEALQFCRQHEPDVVLMDMNMPGMGGMTATKRILHFCPDIKVLALSVSCEEPVPTKVMQLGAAGFISKNSAPKEMVSAIRKVYSGVRHISDEVAQKMALAKVNNHSENPFEGLSDRELQIMLMITRGQKVNDIAEQLSVSAKTVNSYRYRMFEKLAISGDVELTHLALRHGMIDIAKVSS